MAEYLHANRTIHRCIVEESGNEYLLRSFDGIWNRSFSVRMFASIENADLSETLGEHEALVVAMREGPPPAAAEAMIAHIRDGLDLQLRALADCIRPASDSRLLTISPATA